MNRKTVLSVVQNCFFVKILLYQTIYIHCFERIVLYFHSYFGIKPNRVIGSTNTCSCTIIKKYVNDDMLRATDVVDAPFVKGRVCKIT